MLEGGIRKGTAFFNTKIMNRQELLQHLKNSIVKDAIHLLYPESLVAQKSIDLIYKGVLLDIPYKMHEPCEEYPHLHYVDFERMPTKEELDTIDDLNTYFYNENELIEFLFDGDEEYYNALKDELDNDTFISGYIPTIETLSKIGINKDWF